MFLVFYDNSGSHTVLLSGPFTSLKCVNNPKEVSFVWAFSLKVYYKTEKLTYFYQNITFFSKQQKTLLGRVTFFPCLPNLPNNWLNKRHLDSHISFGSVYQKYFFGQSTQRKSSFIPTCGQISEEHVNSFCRYYVFSSLILFRNLSQKVVP